MSNTLSLPDFLSTATPEALLRLCETLANEDSYIENATDGYRFQSTLAYVVSRGERGELLSSHLKEVLCAAINP